MVGILFLILVLFAVAIAAQTSQVRKELLPIAANEPIPVVMVDSSALVAERAKAIKEARKTAVIRNEAWKAVIKEYKATKDSLLAYKIADGMPEIIAGIGQ